MHKEHPAYEQWKKEGSTSETAQVVQDARLELAITRQRLDGIVVQINALQSAFDNETDENKKSELGAELVLLNNECAELERIISDSETEFKDIGASSDMQTLH